MAILNGVGWQAHVELEKDGADWGGYILLEPDIANLRYFDVAGPKSKVVYEGPILAEGKYYFGNGKAQILEVNWPKNPKKLKVAFKGIEQLRLVKTFQTAPRDYLH